MLGLAAYLGITQAQLFKDLSGGKSLAQIAKARGKSTAGLKAAMIASIKSKLDKAVASKMLTSAQEQRILGAFSSNIGKLINGSVHGFGFQRPGRGIPWRSTPKGYPPGPASLVPAAPVGPRRVRARLLPTSHAVLKSFSPAPAVLDRYGSHFRQENRT